MAVQVERRKKTFSGSGKRKSEDKLKSLQELGAVIPEPHRKKADIIVPTPERMAKAGEHFIQARTPEGDTYVVARDAPLEMMHGKKVLDGRQYDAGKKFYLHWYRAGLNERFAALNLSSGVFGGDAAPMGMPASEAQAFHREAYRSAVQRLGIKLEALVVRIACRDQFPAQVGRELLGWSNDAQGRAAATEMLKLALDILIEHYGL